MVENADEMDNREYMRAETLDEPVQDEPITAKNNVAEAAYRRGFQHCIEMIFQHELIKPNEKLEKVRKLARKFRLEKNDEPMPLYMSQMMQEISDD